MTLSHFPIIETKDGARDFGGSQEYFAHPWRRMSGCAAVSAVNIAAFDGIGMEKKEVYTQEEYTDAMKRMFKEHMTSGMMGFPDPEKYISEYLAYAKEHGVSLSVDRQFEREDADGAVSWICAYLKKDRPVVILILNHRDDTLDDIRWHWMVITGYEPEKEEIIVSNYGKKEYYDAKRVFAPDKHNQVYLIAFEMCGESSGI